MEEKVKMTKGIDKPMAASIPELARCTGVSESLLYSLANEGKLPGCRRLSSRFIIHIETFENWLKAGTGDELAKGI
jgi:predicted DNA-binding transcriptional regulator AlpA